jgi:hypothetical protein
MTGESPAAILYQNPTRALTPMALTEKITHSVLILTWLSPQGFDRDQMNLFPARQ